MDRQYSEQELRRMRERAIQGAFEMQRRAQPQQGTPQGAPQDVPKGAEAAAHLRREASPQREVSRAWVPRSRPAPNAAPACPKNCPIGRLFGNTMGHGEQEDRDVMLVLFLVILLMQEGADQSLLFGLIYLIM